MIINLTKEEVRVIVSHVRLTQTELAGQVWHLEENGKIKKHFNIAKLNEKLDNAHWDAED